MTPLGVEPKMFSFFDSHSNRCISIYNNRLVLLQLLYHTTYILPAKLTNQRNDFRIWCCFQLENVYLRTAWQILNMFKVNCWLQRLHNSVAATSNCVFPRVTVSLVFFQWWNCSDSVACVNGLKLMLVNKTTLSVTT